MSQDDAPARRELARLRGLLSNHERDQVALRALRHEVARLRKRAEDLESDKKVAEAEVAAWRRAYWLYATEGAAMSAPAP